MGLRHWRESVAWQQDFVMPVSQIINPSVPNLPLPLGWPAAPTRASCEITECVAEGGTRDGQSLIIEPSSWEYLALAPSSQPEREVCSTPQRESGDQKSLPVSGTTKLGKHVCRTLDGVLLHQAEGGSDQEGRDCSVWLFIPTNSADALATPKGVKVLGVR